MPMDSGYVPPFEVLKAGLAFSADGQTVKMSRELLMLLVGAAVSPSFDRVWYRERYPDVAEAIEAGDVEDELEHFVTVGYEDGRAPAYFEIDEAWYANENPDVASAAKEAGVGPKFVQNHYNEYGYFEGRPSDAVVADHLQLWKSAIEASSDLVEATAEVEEAEPGEA